MEDVRARAGDEEIKVDECSVEQVGIRGSGDVLLLPINFAGQVSLANTYDEHQASFR